MKSFVYERATTTTLKAVGFIDTDKGIIDIDGEEKSIATLLSDFNGATIELSVRVKDREELEAPVSNE